MRVSKERFEKIQRMDYGDLQMIEEYKKFVYEIIENRVYNMSTEVDYILNKSYEDYNTPFNYEDINNRFMDDNEIKDNWGVLKEEDIQEIKDNYKHEKEVLQWLLVGYWLLSRLDARNEVILNEMYWGRCSFGQHISLDSVIIDIFKKEWLEVEE